MGKINNSFNIPRNKPNIRIVTFQGIQIARHHVPRNLDAKVMWITLYEMPP